jgi:ABC-type multidrug transport system ATPase subunit
LLLSAHFFLSDSVTLEQKEALISSVISELGLGKTRDTIIGDEQTRGISGGERKRAAIAVQLIADPAVLFLDEPTSGLDSFQAQAVMESMKSMASNGRCVISVIHQPRSSIFDMFDQLLLLSEGHCIYLGPAKEAAAYFASAGHSMHRFFNPADFFLDILSPDTRSKELEESSSSRIEHLAARWDEKTKVTDYKSQRLGESQTQDALTPHINAFTWERYRRNFKLLFWRAFTEIIRDRFTIMAKIFVTVFFGCIIGAMYSSNSNDQATIYKQMGLLFVIAVNQAFNACIGVLSSFPKEKIIVNR